MSRSNIVYHPSAAERLNKRSVRRSSPSLPTPSNKLIDIRLSEEIDLVRRYIEMATNTFGQDDLLRHRHPRLTEDLRIAADLLREVSAVVMAADKDAAAELVVSEEMKARLTRKPIRPLFTSAH
jgi:hypothetical protein